jgi:tRNA-splicing ligase RtcB
MSWKLAVKDSGEGYYTLHTQEIGAVPVRLFLTPNLLDQLEESIYPQIRNAASFPGVKLVAITPDVHHGYGVPIGTVLLTDAQTGAVAMGPVGYDICCGMMSASSAVPVSAATPENRLRFNREVTRRVALGPGKVSRTRLKSLTQQQFEAIIRGGAAYYAQHYGERVDRTRAERDRLPVDDSWQPPWGGPGRPERGIPQLGTLGGGNHFIELQGNLGTDTLYVQLHSGSRGFGHGLATNYFHLAKDENPAIKALDLGYFTPESAHYRDYLNAVAAGGNFAIVNRLSMFEQIAMAFEQVFGKPLSLVYEISHNLVQREHHPEFGWVHVHRKGATRAFPAGYEDPQAGHPILIPGSNRDSSFILRAADRAHLSGYSVNHGAGRRMSRGAARKAFKQSEINAAYREAGIVMNTDGVVPIDESKDCYKSSREVVEAVTRAGLATIEHELVPLASIKGTE